LLSAPAKIAKMHDALDEKSKKDKAVLKALIRYSHLDILEHADRLKFGEYNPCCVDNAPVQKLLELFYINEVDRYLPDHLIHLFIDRKLLVGQCWSDDKYAGEKLPKVEIVSNAPADWCFVTAGGQHRLEALKLWIMKIQKLLNDKQQEEKKILNQEVDDEMKDDTLVYLTNVLQPQIDHLKAKVMANRSWIIALYDTGVPFILFISQRPFLSIRSSGPHYHVGYSRYYIV